MAISGIIPLPDILLVRMSINTKFTVATEEGMEALLMLTGKLAIEKYASLIEAGTLDRYILDNFNKKTLIGEVNSLSNQWLVVYVDNQPAGYACITSKGTKPESLNGKKAICLAGFGILKAYTDPTVRESLIEKCLSTGKSYENIWVNEYAGNPFLDFFEAKGFIRQKASLPLDLPLESVCLIK